MAFVIVPIIAIIVVWLIHSIFSLGQFLCDILLSLGILMWLIISFLGQIIYNGWWYTASATNNLVAYVWSGVHLPIDVAVHVVKHFGLLSLSVTHLVLRILYYVFLLWIFIYLLMLLYRFVTCQDWAIQFEFYMGPTPRTDNLRAGDSCTLTIAPVLLDHNRRPHLNPPLII